MQLRFSYTLIEKMVMNVGWGLKYFAGSPRAVTYRFTLWSSILLPGEGCGTYFRFTLKDIYGRYWGQRAMMEGCCLGQESGLLVCGSIVCYTLACHGSSQFYTEKMKLFVPPHSSTYSLTSMIKRGLPIHFLLDRFFRWFLFTIASMKDKNQ